MKTVGIILIVIGAISLLGAMVGMSNGQDVSAEGMGGGIGLIVLGAFLSSRTNKKREEEEKKKQWEQQSGETK